MKTFLTEKRNVPEGATHTYDYGGNECGYYKVVGDNWFHWGLSDEWCAVVDNQCFYEATPISQTKEVEWENGLPPVGEECELSNCGNLWAKAKVLYMGSSMCIVDHGYGDQHYHIKSVKFRKPETKEDREKREIEELLASKVNFNNSFLPMTIARILLEAGYRKGGE